MRFGKIVVGLYEASTSAAIRALAEGFLYCGYDIEIRNAYHFKENEAEKYFDLVVCHGLRYKFRDVFEYHQKRGTPVLVFDFGYLDRVHGRDDYFDKYWYLGLGGFGWKPPMDCPKDRFEKLNVEVDYSRRKPTNKIYVCGQIPFDASHRMSHQELEKFYNGIIIDLKQKRRDGYEVLFRKHPLAPDFIPASANLAPVESLSDCLITAKSVIVYNSTVGIDALLVGCPVVCYGDSVYKEFVNGPDFDLNNLTVPDETRVRELCSKLAYSQWTLKECSGGLPVEFLSANGIIPKAT